MRENGPALPTGFLGVETRSVAKLLLPALLILSLVSLAHAGTLRTRDGRTLEGLITLDPAGGALVVAPASGPAAKVPLAQVQHATFEPYGLEATNSVIPADKAGSGNGLLGTYFKHSDFAGRIVHRLDETVNFDWGTGAPIATIHHDYFSVRWSGEVEAPVSGEYTFIIQTDDGGRLWVNNQLLADNWRSPETPEASGVITLEAGKKYIVKYEFHETSGNARARLLWSGPGLPRSVVPRSQLYASSPLGLYSDVLRLPNGLLATYYNDGDLSSSANFARVDASLAFTWQGKPPVPGFDAKNFSVRWTGQILPVQSGSTTFHVQAEGGVRLWVNEQPVIDEWENRKAGERTGTVALTAGARCDVRLELANAGDKPVFALYWSTATQAKSLIPASQLFPSKPTDPSNPMMRTVAGLMGTYFPKPDLTGDPLKRVDANIAFDWGEAAPLAGIPADKFSVRWTAFLKPTASESHTFQVIADDGARLWLDGKLLIDAWRVDSGTNTSQSVALTAGRSHELVLEYFDATRAASVKLLWSSPSTPLQVIPSRAFTPPRPAPAFASLADTRRNFPKGVLTWSGSFLAAPVKAADDSAVVLAEPHKGRRVSLVNVAFIALQPISPQRLAKIAAGREGVLLATGDFVDGEFKGVEDGKVKLSSVLFGLKSYDASYEALAVVLRAPASPPQDVFEVQARDGSVFLAKEPKLEEGALVLVESPLAGLRVRESDLLEVRFGKATNLFRLLLDKAAADAQRRLTDDSTRRALDAEEAALAKAATDAKARMRADADAKFQTDAQARALSEARESTRVALEGQARKAAGKAVVDAAAHARALAEQEVADKAAAAAKAISEPASVLAAEKSKLAGETKNILDKAQAIQASLTRLATEARAAADRAAAKAGAEKNLAEQSFANTKAAVERMITEANAKARSSTEAKASAEKAAAKATADKAAAETAWNSAKAVAEKAAAELASALKTGADNKLVVDKATVESANRAKAAAEARASADKLAAKAVAEKAAAEAAANQAKAAADKAAADLASAIRLYAGVKQAADKAVAAKPALDAAEKTAKASLDRLSIEAASKAKLLAQAQAIADKAASDAKTITERETAHRKATEEKMANTKMLADKFAAEIAAKAKEATTARTDAEKAAAEAQVAANKASAEKSATSNAALAAKGNYDRLAADAAYKQRLALAAKAAADRAMADKLAADKALEEATAATRPTPQKKVRLE